MLSTAKQLLFTDRPTVREIKAGLLRGLRMEFDLTQELQKFLGLRERELHPWFRRLSEGIASAVDIGAGTGDYTLFFLARTGAKRVVSFEPDESVRRRLHTNLELNNFHADPRVLVVPNALGSPEFDETPLDSYLHLIKEPCLVKIDAEGWEERILLGAPALLHRQAVRFIIETHHEGLEDRCAKMLKGAGFHTKIVDMAWWRKIVPELRTETHNRWLVAWRA
jgi:hypothetical protein